MTDQPPFIEEGEALGKAVRISGLVPLAESTSARAITVAEDDTPFLWKQLIGRRAWEVDFEKVSLKLESAVEGFQDRYVRTFTVRIDAESGRLMGIRSEFEGEAPEMRPQPSGEKAESQLRAEEEIYVELPADEPKLNFLQALDAVLSKGVGSPFLAKAIHAVYVMHSRMGSTPRAVWAITLRGLPPFAARGAYGDTIPEWQRNHMRNVVDAETGDVLFATNSPQPD